MPGWQRWMLAPWDASRRPGVARLAAMDARPHRMLLGDQALPGWQRWMLAPSDAFRNRLPASGRKLERCTKLHGRERRHIQLLETGFETTYKLPPLTGRVMKPS